MLALEFLVAADVIRTVLLDVTAKGMGILGALVAIRTFLSWPFVVEIDGRWPWRSRAIADQSEPGNASEAIFSHTLRAATSRSEENHK